MDRGLFMDKQRIVLIDDDTETCGLMKNALERTECYDVFVAHNAKDGEAVCLAQKPDLIFLDFVMPDESGDHVINFLKTHEETKDIPIILMSGMGEMVYFQKKDQWKWLPNNKAALHRGKIPDSIMWKKLPEEVAQEMGVAVYLTKPFSRSAFLELADHVLQPKSGKPNPDV